MRAISSFFAVLFFFVLACSWALAAEKLLGRKIDEAKKTDFFTFFHLQQIGSDTDPQRRVVLTFKPEGEKFRQLVTVKVTLDAREKIAGMELSLARSFVDSKMNGIFARDIAKSMLRTMLPEADETKVTDLINEIEFGFISERPVISGRRPPKLPDQPTPGNQTFLGKRESYEQELGQTKLELRNRKSDTGESFLMIAVSQRG